MESAWNRDSKIKMVGSMTEAHDSKVEALMVRAILLDPYCSGSGTITDRLDHLLPSHSAGRNTHSGHRRFTDSSTICVLKSDLLISINEIPWELPQCRRLNPELSLFCCRICVTVENFESSSMVQGTEGGAKYNCNYCQKDITGKIRIKCAVCLNFDLCVECMSAGAEINTHKCDHAYRVMKTAIEGSAANQKLIEDLTRQCQQEKDKALALEKEVKRLKGNVEQDGMLARADISSLQREKDQLHEEVVQLKIAAETFPKEMEMAVNGAKIVARWELMREWLKQQTNSWKPAAEFRQYRIFMETEAELKNIPPPFFHDEPEIPDESLDQGDDAYMEHDCFLNSVWCGSARRRRRRLTAKSITSLETSHRLGLEKKHWRRYALVSALMMVLVLGIDAEKAMALGPEGPLMEEFWDNVRRYSLYALAVSTGALSAVFEPIFELLKNPITAVLIFIILGGSFVYEYGY
ncbi:hypothetical protein F2Q68_00030513 [Brassica cretica]|uniref:Uncharacterized protein ycf33 n=1 Tax=Brassica cretica TaxID=69181 RepID=A0A8S9G454_BRACR|nr:hypothetical protein F2Q68_00030513 [Brassica cretica]